VYKKKKQVVIIIMVAVFILLGSVVTATGIFFVMWSLFRIFILKYGERIIDNVILSDFERKKKPEVDQNIVQGDGSSSSINTGE